MPLLCYNTRKAGDEMKKKVLIFSAIVLLIILIVINFPIYRLTTFLGLHNFYSWKEMQKVIHRHGFITRAETGITLNTGQTTTLQPSAWSL